MARSVLSVSCDSVLAQRLEQYAQRRGATLSDVVSRAVSVYLDVAERDLETEERVEYVKKIADEIYAMRNGPGARS